MRFTPLGSRRESKYVEIVHEDKERAVDSLEIAERTGYLPRTSQAWRLVVCSGIGISTGVMIANIIILLVGLGKPIENEGTRLFYEGNCETTSRIYTLWHIPINVLSTLLLGASNCITQILAAPTRSEVDAAHAKGRYLHIGMFDFHNLKFIARRRVALCALIAISSIPLHLLYNSTVFTTMTIYDYHAVLVTPDFLQGADFTIGVPYGANYQGLEIEDETLPNVRDVQTLQTQAGNQELSLLSATDCRSRFSKDMVNDISAAVVVVKEGPMSANNSVITPLKSYTPKDLNSPPEGGPSYEWICGYRRDCKPNIHTSNNTWQLALKEPHQGQSDGYTFTIDHCLIRPANEKCSVEFSVYLMIIVIICNAIKLSCFSACLLMKSYNPLITIGDAICSFMSTSDQTSSGLGPISCRAVREGVEKLHKKAAYTVRKHLPEEMQACSGHVWKTLNQTYLSAVGIGKWAATSLFLGLILLTAFALLLDSRGSADAYAYATTFEFNTSRVFPGNFNLLGAILSANAFQLAISIAYILYNGVFTCMMVSAELADFATQAKPMRVSSPQGAQRSTYWLQLPYRWSLPLMTAMALLHWLVSAAVFMVDVKVLNPYGQKLTRVLQHGYYTNLSFCGLAWAPAGAFWAFVVGCSLIIFLFANGLRRVPPKMPLMSSNSMAISAACHLLEQESPDSILKPLKYGVLESDTAGKPLHTGFSARHVLPLQDGQIYLGTPDLTANQVKICLEHIAFQGLSVREQVYVIIKTLLSRRDLAKPWHMKLQTLLNRDTNDMKCHSECVTFQNLSLERQLDLVTACLLSRIDESSPNLQHHSPIPDSEGKNLVDISSHIAWERTATESFFESSLLDLLSQIRDDVRTSAAVLDPRASWSNVFAQATPFISRFHRIIASTVDYVRR